MIFAAAALFSLASGLPGSTAVPSGRHVATHALIRNTAFRPRAAARMTASLPTAPPTYSNPIDPTPLVERPATKPCIVTLLNHQAFAGDALRTANYTPPAACPGPWSRVVFDWDTSVDQTQYDRTGGVWLGGVELLRETTSEPPGAPISYHTEKDVTEYTPVFEHAQQFSAEMANYFDATITGVYYVNARLEFYPASTQAPVTTQPDAVIPINVGGTGASWATLQSTMQTVGATVKIPPNTERLLLEVYASGHIDDEFWYANVPNAYIAAGQSGGTAFREIEVSVDGMRAGVAWPFPYVYSGGFDPGLWIPITGINTHDVGPYLVDLTPFIGKINGAGSHTITMNVDNAQSFWLVDGDLLAYEDHGSPSVTGALTGDTLANLPQESVSVIGYEANPPGTVGATTGSAGAGFFRTTASRIGAVTGYLNTSHGRVQTTVAYDHAFNNSFESTGTYNVQQDSSLKTTTTVASADGTTVTTESDDYPFDLVYLVATTAVHQGLSHTIGVTTNGVTSFSSTLYRVVDAGDVGAAGASTVPTNRTLYQYSDSQGGCYDRTMQAEAELLVEDNITCSKP